MRVDIYPDGALWVAVPPCFAGSGAIDGMLPVGRVDDLNTSNPLITLHVTLGATAVRDIAAAVLRSAAGVQAVADVVARGRELLVDHGDGTASGGEA